MSMCVCEMPVTTPPASARIASSIASRTSILPESVIVRFCPSIWLVSRLKRSRVGGAGSGVRRSWILMGMRVHSPALRDAHPQLYNSRFHSLRGAALALDAGWQDEDGLRGLAYEVESRGGAEALSAAVALLRLRLRLADCSVK